MAGPHPGSAELPTAARRGLRRHREPSWVTAKGGHFDRADVPMVQPMVELTAWSVKGDELCRVVLLSVLLCRDYVAKVGIALLSKGTPLTCRLRRTSFAE